jgi:branched-chain amino acid transport system ATP-binding protein
VTLATTGLSAFYGPFQALHAVSLCVRAGTVHSLLGRNGAGKTTTLRAIFGLMKGCTGEIELHGKSIAGLPPHRVNQLGVAYVPEYRGVFGALTVLENLRIAETLASAWPMDRVLELFSPLKGLLPRKGGTLSGGEQQMLAIGRALMSDPKFLLLDEPSQGLAPLMTDLVMETLVKLRAENLGILLVEQNAEAALQIADDVSVLEQGEIVFQGSPSDLRADQDIVRRYLEVG